MKLVIFDCDGTLVDSQHMIVAAMNSALVDAGLETLPRSTILSIVGLSLPLAVSRLLPEAETSVVERVSEGYRSAFGELRRDPDHHEPLYEGILELIETLSAREDHLLGIATGKSMRGVQALFDRMALHDHFATVQTADTHPSKPDPSMIETAIRETGVDAGNVVMIGDTTFDVVMAHNASVRPIGVSWGYHPQEHLRNAGADIIVGNAADLLRAVDRAWTPDGI